jgi:hypothetical protein
MFCRAKIGVVLVLAGTLTGWAAPLNPDQKNPVLARGARIVPTVVKPRQSQASFNTNSHWRGVKIQKNGLAADSPLRVRPNEFLISQTSVAPSSFSLNPPLGVVVKK